MTDLYHYDDKGDYTHKTEARLDPIAGLPLVPAGATLTAPPPAADNRIARWNETRRNGRRWSITKAGATGRRSRV